MEPIYKMSITSVLSSSLIDLIGPAVTTFSKQFRSILDVMLDGHGFMTQAIGVHVLYFQTKNSPIGLFSRFVSYYSYIGPFYQNFTYVNYSLRSN